jgi:hypothetical protein
MLPEVLSHKSVPKPVVTPSHFVSKKRNKNPGFCLTELVAKRRCYRTNHPPLAARSRPPPSPLVWSH